ncbi:PREDICTED: MD-2-related lipid-recognition protein-like [Drosophila arizonae]|uniref:MD-2-related lipid-recognition protein-like n=1 Tax=Drosophila arizonae TaxID=7263 RepID=A0ABM1NMX5_DROAR|nr:PREDICTED: MD-2-related lipid-recognition protein-like [Drosophila arizonae]
MSNTAAMSLSLLLLLLVALANAEVINYHTCTGTEEQCSIDEVRVDPCPQALENTACRIRRRRPADMTFKFTPKFDAEKLDASLNWVKSETELLPLVTLEQDACKSTSCPVKAGVQQTYAIQVPIESKFPVSTYTIRWALKDPVSSKRCCFNIDIKVVR